MVDAAAQQNWLQARSRVPGSASRWIGGQRCYSSRRARAGRWTSGGKPAARLMSWLGSLISGAVPQWPGAGGLPLRALCGVGTVTGHPVTSPARHFTVIPRWEGCLLPMLPARSRREAAPGAAGAPCGRAGCSEAGPGSRSGQTCRQAPGGCQRAGGVSAFTQKTARPKRLLWPQTYKAALPSWARF